MSITTNSQKNPTLAAEPRWKELYTIGRITCILSTAIIVLGVVAYFIWPYLPGYTTMEQIFSILQNDPLAGLMALDFFLVLGNLFGILLFTALYVSLKRANESYALIALALGLIAAVLIIPARPIMELFSLSDLYVNAVNDAARSQYLAAGEALLALFNGTGWATNTVLGGISFLISALLMLRGTIFSKATAWVGIISNIAVLCFWIPGSIGAIFLFLSLPGYIIWYIQLAPKFFKLGRAVGTASPTLTKGE
jgi:hypothetical protein